MPAPPRRLTWQALTGLTLGLAAVLAACSSSARTDAGAAGTATQVAPSTPPAPTSTTASVEAAVLAAYQAYWDDVVVVGKTSDWQSPRLADHAMGEALAQTRAFFRGLEAKGLVARGTVKVRAKVLELTVSRAVLYDCNSTSSFLAYDAKTGELRDKSSGQSNGKTLAMEPQGGTWKLAQVIRTEPGRCTR